MIVECSLVVPILASSSALSLPQCPTCAAIHLMWTVLCFANSSRASWQWITVLLLFIKQFMIIESHCRYLTEFYFTDSTRYGMIFFKIMNLIE